MEARVRALDLTRALREIDLGRLPTWLSGAVITCIANLELSIDEPGRFTSIAMHGLFAQAETLVNVCGDYRTRAKKRDSA